MTSVLCKSFFEAESANPGKRIVNYWKRIMVTAPTNKAIAVLSSRFLLALNGCPDLNVVLIGVEDKLINDDNCQNDKMKSIFVYSWADDIAKRYSSLKKKLNKKCTTDDIRLIENEAAALHAKLKQSIPYVGKQSGILNFANEFVHSLHEVSQQEKSMLASISNNDLSNQNNVLDKLVSTLGSLSGKDLVDELLATANIIFCTLSSSAVAAIKRTRKIDGKLQTFLCHKLQISL